MNILTRDKQIEIIAALCEGTGQRAAAAACWRGPQNRVAPGAPDRQTAAPSLHDRRMVGIRTGRLELDELWAFVGKKQKRRLKRIDGPHKGDQYTFVALGIVIPRDHRLPHGQARMAMTTDQFVQDLASAG